jgi:hypothetical protein
MYTDSSTKEDNINARLIFQPAIEGTKRAREERAAIRIRPMIAFYSSQICL